MLVEPFENEALIADMRGRMEAREPFALRIDYGNGAVSIEAAPGEDENPKSHPEGGCFLRRVTGHAEPVIGIDLSGRCPLKLLLSGTVPTSEPKSHHATKDPPLPASLLSSLTFCSGRNGGPALGGSKTAHPGAQRNRKVPQVRARLLGANLGGGVL